MTVNLPFVRAMARDCMTRPEAAPYLAAGAKAADRAAEPGRNPIAAGHAFDEEARHILSALVVTLPPSTTTAERLLAAAEIAAVGERRELLPDPPAMTLLELSALPAIVKLQRFVAEQPAIACGEGYWDDQDSANSDGIRTGSSEAAAMIRAALVALGLDAPAGLAVCPECYAEEGDEHHHQCERGQAEAEAEQEEENELQDIVAERMAIGA